MWGPLGRSCRWGWRWRRGWRGPCLIGRPRAAVLSSSPPKATITRLRPGEYRKSSRRVHAVAQPLHAGALRAVVAAVEDAVGLQPMTQNPAMAVRAGGRQRVGRALEAVEHVPFTRHRHLERLVVVVPADLAT